MLAIKSSGRPYLCAQSVELPGGALLIYRLLDVNTHLLLLWNPVPSAAVGTCCQTMKYPKVAYWQAIYLRKFYSTLSPY